METLYRWYQNVIYAADTLAAFELCFFQTADTLVRWGKMEFKNRSLALEINTTLSILLQEPTPNVKRILTSPLFSSFRSHVLAVTG